MQKVNNFKLILLFLMLCPSISDAQTCDSLLEKRVDKFTDAVQYAVRPDIVRLKGTKVELFMSMAKSAKGTIFVNFTVKETGFGCTDEDNKIYFLFTDGTKENFKNSNSFSCSGHTFIAISKNTKENNKLKDLLSTKKISAIKIESRSSSYEVELYAEEAETFRLGASCIFNLN